MTSQRASDSEEEGSPAEGPFPGPNRTDTTRAEYDVSSGRPSTAPSIDDYTQQRPMTTSEAPNFTVVGAGGQFTGTTSTPTRGISDRNRGSALGLGQSSRPLANGVAPKRQGSTIDDSADAHRYRTQPATAENESAAAEPLASLNQEVTPTESPQTMSEEDNDETTDEDEDEQDEEEHHRDDEHSSDEGAGPSSSTLTQEDANSNNTWRRASDIWG